MLSKNNFNEKVRQLSEKREHFSIRKLSVGAVSVLLGLSFLQAGNTQTAHADAIDQTASQVVKNDQNQASQETTNQVSQVEQVKNKVQNFRSQQAAMTDEQKLQTAKSLQDDLSNLNAEETANLATQLNAQTQDQAHPQTLNDIEKQHRRGTYGQTHAIKDYDGSINKDTQLYSKTDSSNDPKITDVKVKDVYLMTGQRLEDTVGNSDFEDLATAKVNGQTLRAGVDQKMDALWGGQCSLSDEQIAYLNQLNQGVGYSSSDYYDTDTRSFDKAGTYYLPLTLRYCPNSSPVSYTAVIVKVTVGLAENVQYQPGYEYDNGLQDAHTLPMNRVVNTNNGTVHAGETITIKPQYQEKELFWDNYDENQVRDYRYGFNDQGREGYLTTNPAAEYEIPANFSAADFTATINAQTGALTIKAKQNAQEGVYTIPVTVTYQDGTVDKISPTFFIAKGNDQVVWGNHGGVAFNGQYNQATVFKFKKIVDHYVTRDITLPKVLFSYFEKDDILSGVDNYQADLAENFTGNTAPVVFGAPVDISDSISNSNVDGGYDGDTSKKFVVSIYYRGEQYRFVVPVDLKDVKAIDGVKVKQGTDLSNYTTEDFKKLIDTSAYDGLFDYTLEWKPRENLAHKWIASGMPKTDKPGKQNGIIRIRFAKNNTILDVPVSLIVVEKAKKPNNQQKPDGLKKPAQKPASKPQTTPEVPDVNPVPAPSQPDQNAQNTETNNAPLPMEKSSETDADQENTDQQNDDSWSETSPVHGQDVDREKKAKTVKHHQCAQKPAALTNRVKGSAPSAEKQALKLDNKAQNAILPATGEKDASAASVIGLAITGIASLFGFADKKRKEN